MEYAQCAACEVAVVEAVLVDERLEAVCQRAHVLVDLRCLGPQLAGIVLEELRIGENRLKLLVTLLIEVAVDIRTKVLDLSDDIPVLILVESLVDKVHHPAESSLCRHSNVCVKMTHAFFCIDTRQFLIQYSPIGGNCNNPPRNKFTAFL